MTLEFQYVLSTIDNNYYFTPTSFSVVPEAPNKETENQGACRVLAFSKEHDLDMEPTLKLFAEHYRNVLDNPTANTHPNIRMIMKYGLAQVHFGKMPLERKPTYSATEIARLIEHVSQH